MSEPIERLLRVCLIATPVGDDADFALDALLEAAAEWAPHQARRAWLAAEDAAPSFVELQQADVAIIRARRMPLAGEALARVQWYCQRGRPLIALQAGDGPTFARWPQFDTSVLGIQRMGTLGGPPGLPRVTHAGKSHPILEGVYSFDSSDPRPQGICLSDDANVLVEEVQGDAAHPMAWTRTRGSARVFATALGQSADLADRAFAQLVGNAIAWVTKAEPN